jgi:hypothetical protein
VRHPPRLAEGHGQIGEADGEVDPDQADGEADPDQADGGRRVM